VSCRRASAAANLAIEHVMTILITGVAGFIGYSVARRLIGRGESVIGIDNLNPYYDPRLKEDRLAELGKLNASDFSFHKVDFADHEALASVLDPLDFDRIIHLGAQAGVRYSIDNPRAYVAANLAGHLNLLEIGRQRGSSHMIYASSSSVYGGNKTLPFRVEDRVDHPISLYAATKKADELMSETYAHLYRLPQTGLRFFTVYGPWGRPDMAMWIFARKILSGEPIQVFNHGRMRRDFTFIDDIVTGVLACLDNPPPDDGSPKAGGSTVPHRLYNIGNSRSEELMRMIGLIEQACGRRAEIELAPLQAGDVPETFADISAIEADLGFEPTTPIDVGIPIFVDWFKAYHQVGQ
jgi:UDP-glucuronate 4-epimerase